MEKYETSAHKNEDTTKRTDFPEYVDRWIHYCKKNRHSLSYALSHYKKAFVSTYILDDYLQTLDWFVHEAEKQRFREDEFAERWVNYIAKYRIKIGNGYFVKASEQGWIISPCKNDDILILEDKEDAQQIAENIGGSVEGV